MSQSPERNLMKRSSCADIRDKIGESLSSLGFKEFDCRQFGQQLSGHGKMYADEVAYYQGNDRFVAISWSVGNGHSCRIGREGDDLNSYETWPTLWSELGMDAELHFPMDSEGNALLDQNGAAKLHAYLKQFPKGYNEMLDFIAIKLKELVAA